MDDKPPPRKQLRLVIKGREKVGELLRRRKRKTDKNINLETERDESDVEDEIPILSRIANPAPSPLSLIVKLKVKPPSTVKDSASPSPLKRSIPEDMDRSDDEDPRKDKSMDEKKAVKVERRKGVIGMDKLKNNPQTAFSTRTVMVQHKAIAMQPSHTQQPTKFNFKDPSSSTTQMGSTPSFGPRAKTVLPKRPQLQQAARNAFLKSKPETGEAVDEGFVAQKQGIQVQTKCDDLKDQGRQSSLASQQATHQGAASRSAGAARGAESNLEPQLAKRMFDGFKLGASKPVQSSQSGETKPISDISHFVRPQTPLPEAGPEVYRSLYHRPNVSKAYMEQSVPDGVEASQFVEDVEIGLKSPKKNENGDVAALVNDDHLERVPLGARLGNCTAKAPCAIFPGQPVLFRPNTSSRSPSKARHSSISVHENLYTEPNRLSTAYLSARGNLKRKRPQDTTLPPPSYIHQHTSSPTFNVFSNGILLYPELCLLLASHLPVQTLINLYSISKDYHVILNQRFTTVILNQATKKAPAAARCYPWRCFAHLCQPDPAYKAATTSINQDFISQDGGATIKIRPPPPATHESTTLPGNHGPHTINNHKINVPASKRKVPTFRWLHMALHREKTIHEIYWHFAARGVPLPGDPNMVDQGSFALTLHKFWFVFDIPDNNRRRAYFASRNLIKPNDLSNILVFVVKLDMLCNEPLAGEKRDGIRKLFMSSANGFDTLRAMLNGEIWRNELEVLRAWTRYGFQLDREDGHERAMGGGWVPLGLTDEQHAASRTVFGIPRDEVGLLKKEFWGKLDYDPVLKKRKRAPYIGRSTMYLMRPDQIVLREAVRRGMKMGKQFLRALMFGYVNEETLTAVPPRDLNGGRSSLLEDEGEYSVGDLAGGVRALSVDNGGDELLDLGDPWEGSVLTVKPVGARRQVLEKKRGEQERLNAYMRICDEEIQAEKERKAYRGFTYVDG